MSERLKIPKKTKQKTGLFNWYKLSCFFNSILTRILADDEMNFCLSLKKCPQTILFVRAFVTLPLVKTNT